METVTRISLIKPIGDRVLVKPLEKEKQERGGLIIPDTAKEKPQEGEVIAVGRGLESDDGSITPPVTKVGNKVLFGKFSGVEIRLDGEAMLLMHESDVLGVLS